MTRLLIHLLAVLHGAALFGQGTFQPTIPKVWDETALADWATPIAGLNVRPTHISAKEYYSLAVDNRRTYPVYYPGREPEGYWEMLQHTKPTPLIEPDKLKTKADWMAAGSRIFTEWDDLHVRTVDPKLVAAARTRATFEAVGAQPLPDGTVYGLRWVPTEKGVALSIQNCAGCHLHFLPDDTPVPGAPTLAGLTRDRELRHRTPLVPPILDAAHVVPGVGPFLMSGTQPLGDWLYQAFGVPWKEDDVNLKLKTMTAQNLAAHLSVVRLGGAILRWNGSPLFPTKIPDLIGVEERKYLDSTATHLHRGIGDLMRYAALVSFADSTQFGPHQVLLPDTKRASARLPDEALYALASYIYSLQPPANPNRFDEAARAGEKLFRREGCAGCHVPPLYTSNKLTLAQGFTPPKDLPKTLDVLPVSVGTDPGLALQTRKGTGFYKVPSLKGVWYRGHYLHDGSLASLEEMFDPDRLKDTHIPGGFTPPDKPQRAIKGHEFGLKLAVEERKQLIAFLRTL